VISVEQASSWCFAPGIAGPCRDQLSSGHGARSELRHVCKGRLAHLKQTLPLLARSRHRSHRGAIRILRGTSTGSGRTCRGEVVKGRRMIPVYCVARGRNLGAAAAGSLRLCFVDVRRQAARTVASWRTSTRGRATTIARCRRAKTSGAPACARSRTSRGPAAMTRRFSAGRGGRRSLHTSRTPAAWPRASPRARRPITHEDVLRLAQYDIKDRRTQQRVNQVYVGAKRQLAKS